MDLSDSLGNLGIDLKAIIFSTINFLVVFSILNVFVFKKVGKILSDRKEKIEKSLVNADKLESEIKRAEEKATEIINEANLKANEIIKKAEEQANINSQEIIKNAQIDSEKLIIKAKEQIELERKQMLKELAEKISNIAIEGAEKIIVKNLDEKSEAEAIKSYINSLNL